ncbi:unnamed protein product [Nezara viridula]|uniref:Uncharacterized protein n=1 Tax=Nezara viridula TaxID=85310 RepID=A0A9P0HK36_NEZVI|nr:unnamed protein product [Nezara viridula]
MVLPGRRHFPRERGLKRKRARVEGRGIREIPQVSQVREAFDRRGIDWKRRSQLVLDCEDLPIGFSTLINRRRGLD